MNVRGLRQSRKRMQVFQWLLDQNMHVYLLQETHLMQEQHSKWKTNWGGECFFSGNDSNKEGVAILINPSCSLKVINSYNIVEGRILGVHLTVNETNYLIVNIYGPNKDSIDLFVSLETFLGNHKDKHVLLGGDFNTVLNVNTDKRNGNQNTHLNCRKKLFDIIESEELTDIWRILNPEKKSSHGTAHQSQQFSVDSIIFLFRLV